MKKFWFHYSKEKSTPGDVWITVHFNGKLEHVRRLIISVPTRSVTSDGNPAFVMVGRGICEISSGVFYAHAGVLQCFERHEEVE